MLPALAAILAVLAPAPAKATPMPWTWSLYENPAAVTFAHEVPDTTKLGEVLECARAGGQVKITVYPGDAAKPEDKFEVAMAAHDAAFQAFLKTGRMTAASGDKSAAIAVAGKDLVKLARFGKLCGA